MWCRQKFRFGSLRMEWTSGHAKTQRRKGRKPKASYKSSDRMRTQIGSCERPMLCNPESSRDCAKNRRADHRSSCSDGISSAANHSNMAIFFASLRLCVRRRIGPNGTVHRAAANNFDFRNRAARGSVCNGLLSSVFVSRNLPLDVIFGIPVPRVWRNRVLTVRVDCTPRTALRGLRAIVLERAAECVQANPHRRSIPQTSPSCRDRLRIEGDQQSAGRIELGFRPVENGSRLHMSSDRHSEAFGSTDRTALVSSNLCWITARFSGAAWKIYHFKNAGSRPSLQPLVTRRLGRSFARFRLGARPRRSQDDRISNA